MRILNNRYGAKTIGFKESFFLIDGRDAADRPIHDLHRFDVPTLTWYVRMHVIAVCICVCAPLT